MKSFFTVFLFLLFISLQSNGQTPALKYYKSLMNKTHQVDKDCWGYIRAASDSKDIRRIDKRRQELIATLKKSHNQIAKVKSFEGDHSLREAIEDYLKLCIVLLNENYQEIMDLEKIAEESYELMYAYISAKELANAMADSASADLRRKTYQFAKTYDIQLVASDNRISRKLDNASAINRYHNEIYLIFFKSYLQEQHFLRAIANGSIGEIEQHSQALETVAREAIKKLEEIAPFRGSSLLKATCQSMNEFYLEEAVRYTPKLVDFYMKKEKMEILKRTIESKNSKNLTNAEVDDYNGAIKDFNTAIEEYNSTKEYLQKYRTARLTKWNDVSESFLKQK